jgi:hypothetical protein
LKREEGNDVFEHAISEAIIYRGVLLSPLSFLTKKEIWAILVDKEKGKKKEGN